MKDSEHPWREDLEALRQKRSPLYDQIGALISELNKSNAKNKALTGWIYALCTLTLLFSFFLLSDRAEKPKPSDYSFTSEEYDALLSQVRSLAHTEGYQEGYNIGKDEGYQTGYDAGMNDGVLDSSEAYAEIASAWSDGYDSGYDTGCSDGYAVGYEDGTTSSVAYSNNGRTGTPESSSPSNVTSATQVVETPAPTVPTYDYIINTRTGKFHYSWCSSVEQMKESNKWYYTGTHDEVVNMGYVPCQRCCP